jgi:hypothetical protein
MNHQPEQGRAALPWKQTASHKAFSLIDPRFDDVDFDVDIAGPLSRLARFTGDIRAGAYSVAQHCVIGADLLAREFPGPPGRERAAAFLLHDAHEAYIGDIATPAQEAINWHLQTILDDFGLAEAINRNVREIAGPRLFKKALLRLKFDLDETIYGAAGVMWPLPSDTIAIIRRMDLVMLAAEVDAFMGGEAAPWGSTSGVRAGFPIPDLSAEGIWSADEAEERYQQALRRYLPARFPHPAFSIEG